jgi:hypothetical protein
MLVSILTYCKNNKNYQATKQGNERLAGRDEQGAGVLALTKSSRE